MPGKKRTVCCNGPDYTQGLIDDLLDFSGWSMKMMLRMKGLTWDYVAKINPALEWEDVVMEGVVRMLEMKSDPRGKGNWKFFSDLARSHQAHYLRSQRRFVGLERLDEMDEDEQDYLIAA